MTKDIDKDPPLSKEQMESIERGIEDVKEGRIHDLPPGFSFKLNLHNKVKNDKGEIIDADIKSISLLKPSNSRELE